MGEELNIFLKPGKLLRIIFPLTLESEGCGFKISDTTVWPW